jgi:hypothetical protein
MRVVATLVHEEVAWFNHRDAESQQEMPVNVIEAT